jgi:hypothetical protein
VHMVRLSSPSLETGSSSPLQSRVEGATRIPEERLLDQMIDADGRSQRRHGTSTELDRFSEAVRPRSVTLGKFHRKAIKRLAAAEGVGDEDILPLAIDFYLGESARRPGWEFPKFFGPEPAIDGIEAVVVEISPDSWDRLSEEAARQRVDPELLARHALSFALAERERRGSSVL